MRLYKGLCFWGLFFSTLFFITSAAYSHTIEPIAGPGGSIWPFWPVSVNEGGEQTFIILPDAGNEIVNVYTDSGLIGPVASYTFNNVTAGDTISAYFSTCPDPSSIQLGSGGPANYNTIMDAYSSADLLGDSIILKAGVFPREDMIFDQNVSIVLDGGKDCDFADSLIKSVVPGSLTIAAGRVTLSNIVIKSPPLCQPGDPNNFPTNPETCDCQDNNCNGLIDEGLTFDADGDGYSAIGSCDGSADDCNDNNPDIHPYGELYGDGIDQDCDGYDLISVYDYECFDCHTVGNADQAHTYVTVPDPSCHDCHAERESSVRTGHYGQTVRTAGNNMAVGAVIYCDSCHDMDHDFYVGTNAQVVWPKVLAVGRGNVDCYTCHENLTTEHETGNAHDNRQIDSFCAECHTSDTSVLGQPGTGTLTSDEDVYALHRSDCLLCHAYNGTKICVRTVEQAIADGLNGNTITCTDCHSVHHSGSNNTVSYDPAVDTSQSSQQGCADCHHDYDTVNGTSVGLSTWDAILVEHDLDGTKDGSSNTCANCHNYDGSGSPPLADVENAINGGSPDTCASCHTDKVPDVDHGVPASGKHPGHLATGISCSVCHSSPPYFNSGTDTNGDGLYDLSETDVCYICHQDDFGNPAADDFKAGWHDENYVLACSSCHGLAPATGTHQAHYNGTDPTLVYGDLRITQDFSGGQVSSVNMIGCGNCHPLNLAFHGNLTWGDVELFNDDEVNYPELTGSLKLLNPDTASYVESTGTCSNVYCHSTNSWVTDGAVPSPWPEATGWNENIDGLPRPLPDNIITTKIYNDVTWDSGETLACDGCHANPPQTSAPDNDGGAGDSHYWIDEYGYENLHVWNMGNFPPLDCRICHYDTVRDPSTWYVDPATYRRVYDDVGHYDKAKHVNGAVDVAFDTVDNFTYDNGGYSTPVTYDLSTASFDPATKTCSNVGCHQQETAVIWGVPYRWYGPTEECNRCHGY